MSWSRMAFSKLKAERNIYISVGYYTIGYPWPTAETILLARWFSNESLLIGALYGMVNKLPTVHSKERMWAGNAVL